MTLTTLGSFVCNLQQTAFLGNFFVLAGPAFLYYSYVPIVFIATFLGFYVFLNGQRSIQSRTLLSLTVFFVLWILNILVQWISPYHTIMMLAWQLTAVFEVGFFLMALYFSYTFFNKKDLPFSGKFLLFILSLITIILVPTKFNIPLYNIIDCEGITGPLWNVIYALEPAAIVLIIYMGFDAYRKTQESLFKRQIIFLSSGLAIFLTSFFLSNLLGEITKIYEFNLWGTPGMLLFLGLLAYMIVQFETFNAKLLGAQALVAGLLALIASILFVPTEYVRVITSITLIPAFIFGTILIRGVKREAEQREQLKDLNTNLEKKVSAQTLTIRHALEVEKKAHGELEKLDQNKSDFIIITQHHLRTPLAQIHWYTDSILNGLYGNISGEFAGVIANIGKSSEKLIKTLNNFLDISQLKIGTQILSLEPTNLKEILEELLQEMSPEIIKRKISVNFREHDPWPTVSVDPARMRDSLSIILDNAIKYNIDGGTIDISTSEKKSQLQLEISNTGILLTKEDRSRIFKESFFRSKEAKKVNPLGMGVGLLVAKTIVQAHRGTISVESNGEGGMKVRVGARRG
ncbi:MAG: ATP-binding protein [Patescibacteria group bacterium]